MLVDPALQADPYPQYEKLRTPAVRRRRVQPAHRAPRRLHGVLRSDDFGVVAQDVPVPARCGWRCAWPGRRRTSGRDPPSMLAVNPPDARPLPAPGDPGVHRARRRRAARAHRGDRRRAARRHGARRRGGGPVDLVAGYASLLPVTVISEVLGVPASMRGQFLAWGDGAAASWTSGLTGRRFAPREANLAALRAWMREHLRRLRARPRRRPALDAGARSPTTTGGLTERRAAWPPRCCARRRLRDHRQPHRQRRRAAVRAPRAAAGCSPRTRGCWPNAVDEVLRFDSPVQRTARRARRDTTWTGVPVAAGELVVTLLGRGQPRPRRLRRPAPLRRHPGQRQGPRRFSSGIHYCLGAALARMEGEVALRALFDRFPELAPAGDAAPPARR